MGGGLDVDPIAPYALLGAAMTCPVMLALPIETQSAAAVDGAYAAHATADQVGTATLPAEPLAMIGMFGVCVAAVTTYWTRLSYWSVRASAPVA